jgi:uncharacterized damage-inducible protein DinB
MSLKNNFELLAKYNSWMNEQLFEMTSKLSGEELTSDSGAFFKSILGTLNHILVGDIIWLKRFSTHHQGFSSLSYIADLPTPLSLSQVIYSDLNQLRDVRSKMDGVLVQFSIELTEQSLTESLSYTNTAGLISTKNFGSLIQHLFNHQTHHRGQVTVLLSQLGFNVESTDFLIEIPDE